MPPVGLPNNLLKKRYDRQSKPITHARRLVTLRLCPFQDHPTKDSIRKDSSPRNTLNLLLQAAGTPEIWAKSVICADPDDEAFTISRCAAGTKNSIRKDSSPRNTLNLLLQAGGTPEIRAKSVSVRTRMMKRSRFRDAPPLRP